MPLHVENLRVGTRGGLVTLRIAAVDENYQPVGTVDAELSPAAVETLVRALDGARREAWKATADSAAALSGEARE